VYVGEKWEKVVEETRNKCMDTWDGHPEDQAHFCHDRHSNRVFVKAKFDHDDSEFAKIMVPKNGERLHHLHQPKGLHNFTEVGFKELDIPADLLADLQAFHKSTRNSQAHPESMPFDDPYLNGRESDTWLSHLSKDLIDRVFTYVRGEVSKWAGVPEENLERTHVFGLRLYHHGAQLNMHCDRLDSHVLSAILQIGRANENDTAPWDLSILDHADVQHRVPARVGQLILYESATCAHGRVEPFPGLEFANAFCHFRPQGWPKAYEGRGQEL